MPETGGMTLFRTIATVAATITMGLAAGLFATFSYAVMPGLRRTDDQAFVTAMRRINEAILNGWFALCFGGALVFTAVAAVAQRHGPALGWVVAALALYAVVLVVTFAVNVPLNNQLAAGGDRAAFEARWVRWNIARAAFSTAAFGCLVWAAMLTGV